MTAVEPKIAERRHRVNEDRARRRLRRVFAALFLIASVVVTWWLFRSPLLSIRAVEVEGAFHSSPASLAAGVGVVEGLPSISVDEGTVRTALLADPWVADATVGVRWPSTLAIAVIERTPVAVVGDGVSSVQVANDGMVLAPASGGGEDIAMVVTAIAVPQVGTALTDPAALGGIAFVAELPEDLRRGAVVTVTGDDVSAIVAGHAVRLGHPIDMEQKARTLAGLIESGIEPGFSIDLIAPLHPAVSNPQPEAEGEVDGPSEGEASD